MATRGTVRTSTNACGCHYYEAAPHHHDLLLGLEDATFDELTSVVELAVTWAELDYSESKLIAPDEWLDFASLHRWKNSERVIDFFLAAQGLRGALVAGPDLAVVVQLEDGDGQQRCSRSERSATDDRSPSDDLVFRA